MNNSKSKIDERLESVLDTYISAYRDLIVTERVEPNSLTLSLPMHLAGSHRVEITVTDIGKGWCVLSDGARTLNEIRNAGHSLTPQMKEKLERIANISSVEIVEETLVWEVQYAEIGPSIQKYLELCKMIGDVYLIHKPRDTEEGDLVCEVKTVLDSKGVPYLVHRKIYGEIEVHPFHFLIPPNGHPGLAVKVVSGHNTHSIATDWYFRCDDIKKDQKNHHTKLALVYDVRIAKWSDASKAILARKADAAIPSNELSELGDRIDSLR